MKPRPRIFLADDHTMLLGAFQRMLELSPAEDAQPPPMTAEQRAASAERSAALLEKMGRADEAAEMRRTAEKLRRAIEDQIHPAGDE